MQGPGAEDITLTDLAGQAPYVTPKAIRQGCVIFF
jgi:hypothetical protein